jgi:acyl-CoA dehydrogenase
MSVESRLEEIRQLARERLLPLRDAVPHDQPQRPLLAEMAACGLLERLFPAGCAALPTEERAAGRTGVSAMELCLLREAIAEVGGEIETVLALQGLGSYPLLQSGRPELALEWIPKVAAGESVAAFALSEDGAGSDPAALRCRAERVAGGWRLHGRKNWVSNAPHADFYTLFARTEAEAGAKGVTAFFVLNSGEGIGGEAISMLAPHAIGTVELEGCFVPDAHVLGDVNAGFKVAMKTLDLFRPSVGAYAVGMGQAALDCALGWAAERRAFGKTLREFQAVSHRLAELATRLQASRLLVRDAAAAFDAGAEDNRTRAAMAKLFATETAQQVVDGAIQVLGARALETGHPLERLYREVRAPRIYEGTTEIQREIISRELFRGMELRSGRGGSR